MTTTALITGGTSGIGRAVADKLAQSGVQVVVGMAQGGCTINQNAPATNAP